MNDKKGFSKDILQLFPLFNGISEDDLEFLCARMEEHSFDRLQPIYSTGDRSDRIFLLKKGVVKIGGYADDGREVIKHVLHPITLIGELALAGELKRKDFAYAIKAGTEALSIRVVDMQHLMRKDHRLAMRVLEFIGMRLQHVEQRLESLIFKDARERIIAFLKDTAQRRGRKVGFETLIKHTLTQQDIANITGTSRQTVTSVMNDLRKSNLIYFNRRSILIRDMSKLA